MLAKRIFWLTLLLTNCTLIEATNLGLTGLTLPELNIIYEDELRIIEPDKIKGEFQSEGNTLPEEVIKRRAIYVPDEWAALRKKVDKKTGYQYFQEDFRCDGYGKVHLVATVINAPVEVGLQAALDYSQDNFGFGRKTIELKLKRKHGREFKLKASTGTILPNSLYKSYDAHGNEVYGYQLLLEQRLPKPVSNRKFVLRVFNHYLPVGGIPLVVSEWYQGRGEGEFKYLRGCETFYPINENTHLFTIKSNADIGGFGGGLQRMMGLDSVAESHLRHTAFGIKERAEKKMIRRE